MFLIVIAIVIAALIAFALVRKEPEAGKDTPATETKPEEAKSIFEDRPQYVSTYAYKYDPPQEPEPTPMPEEEPVVITTPEVKQPKKVKKVTTKSAKTTAVKTTAVKKKSK